MSNYVWSNAATRQQRHRDRQLAGKICLTLEVDEAALYEVLRVAGFVNDAHVRSTSVRAALTQGLQRAVEVWCQSRVTSTSE